MEEVCVQCKKGGSLVPRVGIPMVVFFSLTSHDDSKKECAMYKVTFHLRLR